VFSGRLILRTAATLIAIVAVVLSSRLTFRWTSPGTVYVSPNGLMFGDGSSPQAAFRTIQRALDQALPGDTIRISDGVYYERLHLRHGGTQSKPIVLEAVHPGAVIISWEGRLADAITGGWRDEGSGLHSAATLWPIYRVQLDGAELFRPAYWTGPETLRKLTARENAFSSFCYQEGRVYVWLPDNSTELRERLTTHRRVPEPREWGEFRSANLMIEASHVCLKGLEFREGVGAGVAIYDSDQIHIEDCAFSGCVRGVQSLRAKRTDVHLSLERCLYHNFPEYQWRENWLTWDEVYASYSNSSLVTSSSDFVKIQDCLVVHAGDGVQVSNRGNNPIAKSELVRNLIALSTDDAFEIEGAARNILIRNNVVYECHESLGLSPVERGPVVIEDNLFVHPLGGVNGAQVKLIAREADSKTIQNITIRNNLFIGNWLCWWTRDVQDTVFVGNAFVVSRKRTPPWPSGVNSSGNRIIDRADLQDTEETNISDELTATIEQAIQQQPHLNRLPKLLSQPIGPTWWKMNSHPATRGLMDRLSSLSNAD
jgi:Chondroitinase B